MSLALAPEAIERGSCLELFYGSHCIIVDPQIAGSDFDGHPMVLGVERSSEQDAPLAQWLLLRLDEARLVDVSGYLSEGLRLGATNTGSFASIDAITS